jgi:hypothetical protein
MAAEGEKAAPVATTITASVPAVPAAGTPKAPSGSGKPSGK